LAGLQLIHEARDERFAQFWQDRAELSGKYETYIAAIEKEQLLESHGDLTTKLVFGLVESVLTWFDRDSDDAPAEVATAIARAVLGIVCVPEGDLDLVEAASVTLRERFGTSLFEADCSDSADCSD
jgi:hypothetical protein